MAVNFALVNYSSSESEAEDDKKKEKILNVKPKLPMLLAVENQSLEEDPEVHQMRKRTIAHVDGNWPSHVFINCKCL